MTLRTILLTILIAATVSCRIERAALPSSQPPPARRVQPAATTDTAAVFHAAGCVPPPADQVNHPSMEPALMMADHPVDRKLCPTCPDTVLLLFEVLVLPSGETCTIRFVRSTPVAVPLAVVRDVATTLTGWHFQPARLGGRPIPTAIQVTVVADVRPPLGAKKAK
jgi:hypothetical protein